MSLAGKIRGFGRGAGMRFAVAGELMGFLWRRKLWWLIPCMALLLLLGLLLILTQGNPLAPFIYTLF